MGHAFKKWSMPDISCVKNVLVLEYGVYSPLMAIEICLYCGDMSHMKVESFWCKIGLWAALSFYEIH